MSDQLLELVDIDTKTKMSYYIRQGATVLIADDGILIMNNKGILIYKITPQYYATRRYLIFN